MDADVFRQVLERTPYARFLGLQVEEGPDGPVAVMPAADHLIGNPLLPALHGGATAAFMELAAAAGLAAVAPGQRLPRPINVSVAYLRSGRPQPVRARVRPRKVGRRVAYVEVEAWQEDPEAPVATLTAHFLLPRDLDSQSPVARP